MNHRQRRVAQLFILVSMVISATGCRTGFDRQPIASELIHDAIVLAREKNGWWARAELAAYLAEFGHTQLAEEIFEVGPTSGEGSRFAGVRLRLLATGYANGGNLDAARRTISLIPPREKNYADQRFLAWLHVGRALVNRGMKRQAREALNEATSALGPTTHPMLDAHDLAEVAGEQARCGDKIAARATFERAIAIALTAQPNEQTIPVFDIAEAQLKFIDLDYALATVRLCDRESDQKRLYLRIVQTLTSLGRLDEALGVQKQAESPSLDLADTLERAGRATEAHAIRTHSAESWKRQTDPDSLIRIAIRLGESHVLAGDRDRGAYWLERAALVAQGRTTPAEFPGIEKVTGAFNRQVDLSIVASAFAKAGFVEQARRYYALALEASKGHQPGMWSDVAVGGIAQSQATSDLPDDALRTLDNLPENRRDWLHYKGIGAALVRAGRLPKAIQLIEAHKTDNEEVAEALLKIGDRENALTIALQWDPNQHISRKIAASDASTEWISKIRQTAADPSQRLEVRLGLLLGALDAIAASSRKLKNPRK